MNKVIDVSTALDMIKDGDAIALASAGQCGWPKYLVDKLEERFLETGKPRGLTIYAGCGQDDDRFAHPGFAKRFIASHPKTAPAMLALAVKNEIEAYALPQGILQQLYRCTAAKQPGLLSKIGIGTYIDPRQLGGKICEACTDDIVKLMEIEGEEWLFYKSLPVTATFLRGTTADENGNITLEHEALRLEVLEIALAAKAAGGKVIVQVKQITENGRLNPKDIVIPAELVNAVVICKEPEIYHKQSENFYYNPYLSGEHKAPASVAAPPPSVLNANDIVCRRAGYEMYPGAVINIGVGIGIGAAAVAASEGLSEKVTSTVELGVFGGTPLLSEFPAALNPTALISHVHMFDFYHAGGLDIAFLGAAQVDSRGNVNASMFDNVTTGQGGFIDISSTSRKVVFCTYFKAKGLQTSVTDGKLNILQEGKIPKLVADVDQITFNGELAAENGKEVVICTERAVFKLTKDGMMLTEIAPGIDLEKDILSQMGFKPIISDSLKTMDPRIFTPCRMGCFDC